MLRPEVMTLPGCGEPRNPGPGQDDIAIGFTETGKTDSCARMTPHDSVSESKSFELLQQNLRIVERRSAWSADQGRLLQSDQQRTARGLNLTRDRGGPRRKI